MKKICILSGGTLEDEVVDSFLKEHPDFYRICVDGALETVDRLGIAIDYLIGDYDSVSAELLKSYQEMVQNGEKRFKILKYNPMKDETDTHLAVQLAIKLKAEEIAILGATGTRIDHVIANIHILKIPMMAGINAYILDKHNKIYLKDQPFKLRAEKLYGPYLSLIPIENKVSNVSLRGFRYETRAITFPFASSLGVSNELVKEEGSVEFQKGIFMVVEARD